MQDFFEPNEDEGIVWRDVLITMVGVLLSVVIMLFCVTQIRTAKTSTTENNAKIPSDIMIEIQWDGMANDDVDLWLQSPDGTMPVGYSNKNGKVFDLLRDDMGYESLAAPQNHYEVAYSRGRPPGEYIVNIQFFNSHSPNPVAPIKVAVSVYVRANDNKGSSVLLIPTQIVTLNAVGDEKTIFRFTIDNNGKLVPGSVNSVFKELKDAK